MGHNEWRVLAKLCERLSFDDYGNATAWRPRAEIADELGLELRQVSGAVRRLVKKKVLSVNRAGHSGRATVYNVMPGTPWPKR